MTMTPVKREPKALSGLLCGAALALVLAAGLGAPVPAAAQEVVQALPPREAGELNIALRTLARKPRDLEALVSAGNASLALNDASAAAGFFTRAASVAPADQRVLLGTARVALAQRRPVDALAAFTRAEEAGVGAADLAADRALAYDLVGDQASAQAIYRTLIGAGAGNEVKRRYALSLAISGNRNEFERTLFPMLKDEDRGAYRTRAFGLAILGLTDEAVGIADAMMPTDLALRMAPYLRYMPRLTKAQQAAAGNLGAFPAAADIGRDSPDIAAYAAAGARIAARGDSSLTPTGAPLGRRTTTSTLAPTRATTPAPSPPPAPKQGVIAVRQELPAVTGRQITTPVPIPAPSPAPMPVPPATPERPSVDEAFADLGAAPLPAPAAGVNSVDVAALAEARRAAEATAAAERAARLAQAKAAKDKADKAAAAKAAKEKADRLAKEKAEKLAQEKAAKAEPARLWLQLGVGRNVSAFALDWKKLAKEAGGALDGKGPWAIKYGSTNRMLAGPYPSVAAQRAALKRLKDKGVDALPVSSDEGEKVTKAG